MTSLSSDYANNHWLGDETRAEHAERVEAAEARAGWFFEQATKAQRDAYTLAIADLRGLSGPRYDRAREAAKAAWHASTVEAAALFDRTADAIMRDGEVSESAGAEWDALCAKQSEREAA